MTTALTGGARQPASDLRPHAQSPASAHGNARKHGPFHKIVILGDGGVGKSALTMQFVCHEFLDYHDPTIEDSYQHQVHIDSRVAHLDILDTAGQPEFATIREQYMRTGEGYVICYSITDKRSFEEAIEYKKLINRYARVDHIPIVLVGNKSDLEHLRRVGVSDGEALSKEWACPFHETSAALRRNVDVVFHDLIREIRRKEHDENVASLKDLKKQQSKTQKIKRVFKEMFKK
ncbi:hypothetical protein CAPTEDRAFT_158614 [Capitella teleta]|uniref:small monomeric GTPase n=1 Tax=Capitella teleta TaxID=283909 RepID=R7UX92_CAPTE|nr:hypothetical protein CAPTEDRAFT_158614 [Capitella teleta]|eukprot:ELU08532.1 hypothetical protein CAPTEDRAFT_158614 [Capitella teleta]